MPLGAAQHRPRGGGEVRHRLLSSSPPSPLLWNVESHLSSSPSSSSHSRRSHLQVLYGAAAKTAPKRLKELAPPSKKGGEGGE